MINYMAGLFFEHLLQTQDLISIHNAENWLGMDGDVELSMFGNNKNDSGGSGLGSTGSNSSGNSDCSSPTSSNGTSSSTGTTKTNSGECIAPKNSGYLLHGY